MVVIFLDYFSNYSFVHAGLDIFYFSKSHNIVLDYFSNYSCVHAGLNIFYFSKSYIIIYTITQ